MAEETIASPIEEVLLDKDFHTAVKDYTEAVLHGIVKIASKMGISTLQSYQSAQIFEAVGIDRQVIDAYFTNTVSRVGGIGLKEIGAAVERTHSKAFDPLGLEVDLELDSLGSHKARSGGEDHLYDPQTIHLLQQATRRGDYDLFKQYTALVDDETKPHTLRGLMEMRYLDTPIPLEEVAPEDWDDKDTNRVVTEVVSQARDGGIILLHDIYPESVDAALEIVDQLHAQGYYFCTIDQLFAARGLPLKDGEVYWNAYP